MARFNRLTCYILISVALRAYSLPLAQLQSNAGAELARRGCFGAIKGFCERIGLTKPDVASEQTTDPDVNSEVWSSRPVSPYAHTYPPTSPMTVGGPGQLPYHSDPAYRPTAPYDMPNIHQAIGTTNTYTAGGAGTYNQAGSSSGARSKGIVLSKGVRGKPGKPQPGKKPSSKGPVKKPPQVQKASKRVDTKVPAKTSGKKAPPNRKSASAVTTKLAKKAAGKKRSGKTKAPNKGPKPRVPKASVKASLKFKSAKKAARKAK